MERTKECLAQLKAWPHEAKVPDVIIIIGRTGVGKSSLMEDLTNSQGHAQESLDSATTEFAIDMTVISNHHYFIMDTPGFDAYQQEHAFDSIVNGIRAVKSAHPDARIAGILYITGVNQPRFEDLDHQLFWFVHAFCGDAFIKRGLIFVTTFWTATGDGQKRAFMSKLEQLQIKWNEGDAVAMPEFYNHGCGYDADGKLDGSFIDWFSESGRDQIARHAREMVARYYGDSDTEPATLRIVQELDAGTPVHATEAGILLGMESQQEQREKHQQQGQTNTSRGADDNNSSPTDHPERPDRDSPAGPPSDHRREPDAPTVLDTVLRGFNWIFNNVDPGTFFSGATSLNGGQTVPGMPIGNVYKGPFDPLSVVDVMKSLGMDSSRAARRVYGDKHGIQGVPFSAQYNDAMRIHLLKRNGL